MGLEQENQMEKGEELGRKDGERQLKFRII